MLFNSYTFIIFSTLIVTFYYSVEGWRIRKFILLMGSYLFYAAWNPPFVILLWISTLIDWSAARQIYRSHNNRNRVFWLAISLLTNLGLLAFFKYGNFVIDNLNMIFPINYQVDHYSIILPVGISFYTFQTLSYTIDIYRDQAKPWHNFLDYALYVTFFPQLVAGPIVRSHEFLNQCKKQKSFTWDNFGEGIFWLITGLFLKTVLADHFLAPVSEQVYVTSGKIDTLSAWIGTLAFSGQILCDFSGYSICAIGIARILGFHLPKNFRFPYAASGFSDFWRRWHISLSTWLRDYLYIPLGGSKEGQLRTYQNLMMTMLIGGLWHGASWTFVVWGGLHGVFLTIERFVRIMIPSLRIPEFIRIIGVFFLVCITWVFFRAVSFEQAWYLLKAMFGVSQDESILGMKEVGITSMVMLIILGFNYLFRNMDLEVVLPQLKWWKVSITMTVMLYMIFTLTGEDRSFIYFQF
ncbi:MAG: MBOAT family O-acyltransferase [Fulvivirga sp.]|uniref:MBOAT family O-acyltransferase n=1 Tax=Fulvivirga sp. TaxID=1931237 RepID=UPI0032F079FB